MSNVCYSGDRYDGSELVEPHHHRAARQPARRPAAAARDRLAALAALQRARRGQVTMPLFIPTTTFNTFAGIGLSLSWRLYPHTHNMTKLFHRVSKDTPTPSPHSPPIP